MLGLVTTLNIAKKGMAAQQASINVSSHNIANANTEGYSRQRANLITARPFATPTMNSAAEPGQMGTGVDVASIDRIRNSFLDYQVRVETSNKGKYSVREQFLSNIEAIMNEPKDSGISNAMSEFYASWQNLSTHPESSETRTSVAQKSVALTDMLNHTYTQLEKLKSDVHETTKQSVFQINDYLTQLDSVNQEIMQISISGQSPNDLEDRRDLLLDKLSAVFNINIDRSPNYNGQDIAPADAESGVADTTLVKSVFNQDVKRFSYINSIQPVDPTDTSDTKDYTITYYSFGDMTKAENKHEITVNMSSDEYKQLDECRVLWADKDGIAITSDPSSPPSTNDPISDGSSLSFSDLALFKPSSGELSGQISTQVDIDDYEASLNSLAKTIALSVNAVHEGMDTTKVPFFVNNSDNNNEAGINAGNITVNKDLINDVMKIKASTNGDTAIDGTADGNRALAIAQLKDSALNIQNVTLASGLSEFISDNSENGDLVKDSNGVYTLKNQITGIKLDAYFNDIVSKLGVQSQEATKTIDNKESLLTQFRTQRDSVSGVSLDEEMANLIQYQHAYSANAKIISIVDQLLDVVVNSLKR